MSLTKVCECLDPFFAHFNFIEYAAPTTPPKKNATLKFIRNGVMILTRKFKMLRKNETVHCLSCMCQLFTHFRFPVCKKRAWGKGLRFEEKIHESASRRKRLFCIR